MTMTAEAPSIQKLVTLHLQWVRPNRGTQPEMIKPLLLVGERLRKAATPLLEQQLIQAMCGQLYNYWYEIRATQPNKGIAYGTEDEALKYIQEYVEYIYRKVFLGLLSGSRAYMRPRFENFADGYWFVLCQTLQPSTPALEGEKEGL